MALSVTFLGTGGSSGVPEIGCSCSVCTSSNPRNIRTRASLCIQYNGKNIVFDTSPEFRMQVLAQGIKHVDALLFTHHHADHIMGLADIRPFNFKQNAPVNTFASPRTADYIRKVFPFIFDAPDELKQFYPRVDLISINGSFDVCGLTIHPFTVYHGIMPVTAFRFENTAYITDVNNIPEENFQKLTNLDLLILEAFRFEKHISHYSLDEAVSVAGRIKARQTLFTHISHAFDHNTINSQLPPGISLAYDGLTVIPAEIR